MAAGDRVRIARESYEAFAAADRGFFVEHLAEDFSFSSPPDPKLDREGWFERCWPGAGGDQEFEFEVLTFDDEDRIVRTEVYFGWNLT